MDNNNPHQQQPYYEPPPMYTPPGQASGYPNHNYDSSAKSSAPPLPQQQPTPNHHQSHPQSATTQSPTQPMIIYANTQINQVTFGPYPMRYTCPNCNAHVMTETHSVPGILTYVLSGALCFLAWYLCCCLIPCCVRECKDIEHRCPNCKHRLGLFKRI